VRQREPREIWRGVRRVSGSRCMQQGWAAGAQQARAVSWAGREAYRCARCEGLGRFESSADALNRLVQIQVSADLSKSPSVPGRRRSVRARPPAHDTARACCAPAAQPCCMHLLPDTRRTPRQISLGSLCRTPHTHPCACRHASPCTEQGCSYVRRQRPREGAPPLPPIPPATASHRLANPTLVLAHTRCGIAT
jgi:hypothetical protein